MLHTLIIVAISITMVPFLVYFIYLINAIRTKDDNPIEPDKYPEITMVIPTYNEEDIITERIKNLRDIKYPTELIHAIVVDDKSEDNTINLAHSAFEKYNVSGETIIKPERTGTNDSVNIGIEKAKTDIVVTTDADVMFDNKSLNYAVGRLLSDNNIGAICGRLIPFIDSKTYTTNSEKAYRSIYGKMCQWESKQFATYCFNGPLIVMKKRAFSPIPFSYGASDASMALSIIRNGFRTIFEPHATFHEYIAPSIQQQSNQKTRRSARLLEATSANIDMIPSKFNKFGTLILPLRFLMFLICPHMIFISIILWCFILGTLDLLLGLGFAAVFIIITLSGYIKPNILSSFIWHQAYLILGRKNMFKNTQMWKKINRKQINN